MKSIEIEVHVLDVNSRDVIVKIEICTTASRVLLQFSVLNPVGPSCTLQSDFRDSEKDNKRMPVHFLLNPRGQSRPRPPARDLLSSWPWPFGFANGGGVVVCY